MDFRSARTGSRNVPLLGKGTAVVSAVTFAAGLALAAANAGSTDRNAASTEDHPTDTAATARSAPDPFLPGISPITTLGLLGHETAETGKHEPPAPDH